MRAPNKRLLAAVTMAVALIIATPAAASGTQPTPAQIRAAISTATHSNLLWATINSCNDAGDHVIGIRGQMPALAFPSHLAMVVTLMQWSPTAHRYVALRHTYRLGGAIYSGGSVVQGGVSVSLPGSATLVAQIDFEWIRDGRVLGSTTKTTSAGHTNARGTPSGYSVATCSIT